MPRRTALNVALNVALNLALTSAFLTPAAARAAAVTDGSVGAVQTLSGTFTVPQTLGTVRGNNLFHSFTRFGVAAGESATFTTSDAALRHVISRVTGTEPSLINGPVRLDAAAGSQPSFWFVNPNGIVVGAGGRFDVPASLHLSTAPQLQFADGAVWDARDGSGSSLSVAAPERFGFVGNQAAAALQWRDSNLALQPGHTLSLTAGDVTVERALLFAPAGQVSVRARGDLSVQDGGQLQASAGPAAGSGRVAVEARSLVMEGGDTVTSGLYARADASAGADTASIDVVLSGELVLFSGGEIFATSQSTLPAATIRISADSVFLADFGGVSTGGVATVLQGSGGGGTIDVTARTQLAVLGGSQIFTAAQGRAEGGGITLDVGGDLTVDALGTQGGIYSHNQGGSGRSGTLNLNIGGLLRMAGGAQIGTSSYNTTRGGDVQVQASRIVLDGDTPNALTGLSNSGNVGGAGALSVQALGEISLLGRSVITSSSSGSGSSGPVQVSAADLTLNGGGQEAASISSLSTGSATSADVNIDVSGTVRLTAGGQLSAATLGAGAAGAVSVKAGALEAVGGGSKVTGVFSNALLEDGGPSGSVKVDVGQLRLTAGAAISGATLSAQGAAGALQVLADTITIDGQGVATGIDSYAYGPLGNAGNVRVEARGELVLKDGGGISAGTLGRGDPGRIEVRAGSLLIDGQAAHESFTGIGGDALGAGAGATVDVQATQIRIREGGGITTSTSSDVDAGSLRVVADTLLIDGGNNQAVASGISADSSGAGRAGRIDVVARSIVLDHQGFISSSAVDVGAGGTLAIDAQQMTLAHNSGIFSVAVSSGAAGNIELQVRDALLIDSGGSIVANTGGTGAAGRIRVQAGSLTLGAFDTDSGQPSRISSRTFPGSGGQPGNITIEVAGAVSLQDSAVLSIANEARVADPQSLQPTLLSVRAASLDAHGADITAASSGNADAGRIEVHTSGAIRLADSRVRTSSVDGDGGAIDLQAGSLVRLSNSQVSTSVTGSLNGNGGDILIGGRALVLQSGFVQANTAAARARGGDVRVAVDALVPDGSNVFVGGDRIAAFVPDRPGFNVIQAAAPEGVSGTLAVTVPQLSLSATLVGLSTPRIDFGPLGRDLCEIGGTSSFGVLGRGALRESADSPLRIRP
jgi:filamentous hemagglutinin family protein